MGLDWKIVRKGEAWAEAIPESGQETIEELAELIKLNVSEYDKWLKGASDPHWGGIVDTSATIDSQWCGFPTFKVPNHQVFFKSRLKWGDGGLGVHHARGEVSRRYREARAEGYKVTFQYGTLYERVPGIWSASITKFKNLWKVDGITGVHFGGHGNKNGFIFDSPFGRTVNGTHVNPPYKLSVVGAYHCHAERNHSNGDKKNVRWSDHVSKNGVFNYAVEDHYCFSPFYREEGGILTPYDYPPPPSVGPYGGYGY